MNTPRDLSLILVICLLVTLPLSNVKAQLTCSPISSLRTTPVTCAVVNGVCTLAPTPAGTVAMVSSVQAFGLSPAATCSIATDLTVTVTNGAIACSAVVTSCDGGVVVAADSDESVEISESVASVESSESVASVESSESAQSNSAASVSGGDSR